MSAREAYAPWEEGEEGAEVLTAAEARSGRVEGMSVICIQEVGRESYVIVVKIEVGSGAGGVSGPFFERENETSSYFSPRFFFNIYIYQHYRNIIYRLTMQFNDQGRSLAKNDVFLLAPLHRRTTP